MMTGAELKAKRKELKLSLADVSRQLECSAATLCRWESGKSAIPLGAIKLFRLLNKLDTTK
jgi:transcriptional regulator with XRE-family HTH domain